MFHVLATAEAPDIHIPFSVVLTGATAMVSAIGIMFKMLIAAQTARIAEISRAAMERTTEMAKVIESLVAEMKEQWQIVERNNHIRLLELIALPHISPQIRDDARRVCAEIEEAETDSQKRRERR